MDCLQNITCWLPENPYKIYEKNMKIPCKIDTRKSEAKSVKKERKWSPKGSQNPLKIEKIRKKTRSENRCEKRALPRGRGVTPRVCAEYAGGPKGNLISTRFPSEKQQERKQPAGNLSENKLNELRRKTVGKNR